MWRLLNRKYCKHGIFSNKRSGDSVSGSGAGGGVCVQAIVFLSASFFSNLLLSNKDEKENQRRIKVARLDFLGLIPSNFEH